MYIFVYFPGFLWAGDEIIPGNLGLRDQFLAFNWTYSNIEAFGGDLSSLGLVGQNSGAASISYNYIDRDRCEFSCLFLEIQILS